MSGSRASAPENRARPHRRHTGTGVRKVIYRDPDGNEIGFGHAPLE
jgi:hypothetical protein